MTDPFQKQQTAETIHQNVETWHALHFISNEQAEANRKTYQAEKTRKYKIRMINEWRKRRPA